MQSADKLLFALHEIFQVALCAESSQTLSYEMKRPAIRVTMKQACQKQGSDDDNINIFNIKVSCTQRVGFLTALQDGEMPALYSFVGAMQEHKGESNLAVQTVKDIDLGSVTDRNKTTHILWLEQTETNGSEVKVTNSVDRPVKKDEDCCTVIQLRAFLGSLTDFKVCKEVCSLIEAVKFLNPE
ncbi:hypothetical protein EGW08_019030, partial [Elysia chlorotica]